MTSNLNIDVYYGEFMPWSNSVVLEGPNELLLIDAQFLKPDAAQVVQMLKAKGKPLAGILITHSHPDHVWGAATVVEAFPGTPVYARADIAREIDLEFRARQLRMLPLGADKIPTDLPPITPLVGEVFTFDNQDIQIMDLLPAETANSTAFYVPESKTLLAGDLLYNHCHYYIGAGLNRPELWIDAIEDARSRVAIETVIPGHGAKGGMEIFDQGLEYLDFYRSVAPPMTSQIDIIAAIKERYPDLHMEGVLYLTREPAITHPQLLKETGGHMSFGTGRIVDEKEITYA
ncbi:MAG: MBL fold metallo-hydrolase [Gammaproteobacteria bacterium]|nr:MBL fold metallo-hydrolase [Gammaproteobacteria bacterium]MBT8477032.1 MBL fold metallo-hydrolase [Alphaproteobacteria bacterium]